MPPRFAYWTILIDNQPTAFRAAKREELQPTFVQLKRTNANIVMRWFARGRLWDTPEQAQWAARNAESLREKRARDWRPGGNHRDPRAQFARAKKKPRTASNRRPSKPAAEPAGDRRPLHPKEGGGRPWRPKGAHSQRDRRMPADKSRMFKRPTTGNPARRRREPGEEDS